MRAYSYSLLQAVPEDLGKHANNQALSHFFVSACSVFSMGLNFLSLYYNLQSHYYSFCVLRGKGRGGREGIVLCSHLLFEQRC